MSLSFLAGVSHNVGFSGFGFTMMFIRAFRFGSLLLPLCSSCSLPLSFSALVSPFYFSFRLPLGLLPLFSLDPYIHTLATLI